MPSKSSDRQGQAWSADEDEKLRSAFVAGATPRKLATSHRRTPGAVTSRLRKLGLISDDDETQDNNGSFGSKIDRLSARIPIMSSTERQNLQTNCERILQRGSVEQQKSATRILELLASTPAAAENSARPPARELQRNAFSWKAQTQRTTSSRREFIPDKDYERLPGVRDVLSAIDAQEPAVLVLGRAGTGKTTLIRYLRQRTGGDTQAIVAPTGIAAQNASAQTIHSFFHLPPTILNSAQLPEGKYFGPLYKKMTRLVIDEISMVRADLLDAIDIRLQTIRDNRAPFGGVQLMMVGDFLQLPPVVQDQDREILVQLGYKTPFAFSAKVFQNLRVTKISLDQVYRQNEQDFIELLGKVRSGTDLDNTVDMINAHCYRAHRDGAEPLLLTSTVAAAERYNRQGLEKLSGEASIFAAEAKGKPEGLQIPKHLELKMGARVIGLTP